MRRSFVDKAYEAKETPFLHVMASDLPELCKIFFEWNAISTFLLSRLKRFYTLCGWDQCQLDGMSIQPPAIFFHKKVKKSGFFVRMSRIPIKYIIIFSGVFVQKRIFFCFIISAVFGQSGKRKVWWSSKRSSPSFFSIQLITDSSTVFPGTYRIGNWQEHLLLVWIPLK